MPAGRPRKYKTKLDLEVIINAYFAECESHWIEEDYYDYPLLEESEQVTMEAQPQGGALKRVRSRDTSSPMTKQSRWVRTEREPYTMAGLARRIGLSRQAIMEYKRSEEFGDTIIEARERVAEYNEIMLHKGKNSAGAIFNLRVNFKYFVEIDENPPPENPIVFINNVPIDGMRSRPQP